jgi:hypothetical protein
MNELIKGKRCCLTCQYLKGKYNKECSKGYIWLKIEESNCCDKYTPIYEICGTCEHSKINTLGTLVCYNPRQNSSCFGRTVFYNNPHCDTVCRYKLAECLSQQPKEQPMIESKYLWEILKNTTKVDTAFNLTETQIRARLTELSIRDNCNYTAIAFRPHLTISTQVKQSVDFVRETINYGNQ